MEAVCRPSMAEKARARLRVPSGAGRGTVVSVLIAPRLEVMEIASSQFPADPIWPRPTKQPSAPEPQAPSGSSKVSPVGERARIRAPRRPSPAPTPRTCTRSSTGPGVGGSRVSATTKGPDASASERASRLPSERRAGSVCGVTRGCAPTSRAGSGKPSRALARTSARAAAPASKRRGIRSVLPRPRARRLRQ